jgi:hypothetical protein
MEVYLRSRRAPRWAKFFSFILFYFTMVTLLTFLFSFYLFTMVSFNYLFLIVILLIIFTPSSPTVRFSEGEGVRVPATLSHYPI